MVDEDDILDYLEHHGVKGMKWGVRNEDEPAGEESAVQKDLKAHPSKPLTPEQKANIAIAEKKFEAQREGGKKGWRPTKKQLIIAGVGAAAVTGIIAAEVGRRKYLASGARPYSIDQYKKFMNPEATPGWLKEHAGKHMSTADFRGITANSTGRVWGNKQYLTAASFDQKETIFPAGHKFFRVSHRVEKDFRDATYMVASEADMARYQLGWKAGMANLHTFSAKDQIKVPDLYTRLEATREVMKAQGHKVTPEKVMQRYSASAGSSWESKYAKAFFENLKSKGYHAIVDDMDAGVYGEMPLVLFDKSRVTDKIVTLERHIDVAALEKILTDLPNRR